MEGYLLIAASAVLLLIVSLAWLARHIWLSPHFARGRSAGRRMAARLHTHSGILARREQQSLLSR